ncbi:Hypothetical protein SCF082_LOCUS13152 [Durusdinium trenchii]|uniref:FHA domain-containing protein n=1 Tax=Durusdinium trenchii TaxID=1381693 RepID=A0ABP0JPS1_9DINO
MHRDDSLSEMMAGERGRGLADLKGWDPLDRRIEVEKKEKYGQALRDQMAMNSARGAPGETSSSPLPPSRGSSCTRAAGEAIASPHSGLMHGPLVTDSSAASKVAQVQELMRQRLQAVQDEQQRQWHEIQLALNGQLHAAKEAAEEAVRREFGEVMQGQAAEMQNLRKALSDMMQSQRATEEHAGRQVDALAGELADARAAIQRFEAETGGWQSQIRSLNHAVEELARAKQEQAAHQDAAHRELAEAQEMERLQDVEGILNELRGQLREHGLEIDRLKVAHQECASARLEMQRQMQKLHDDHGRLGCQISEVQSAVSRLRQEVPQLAEAAAHRLMEGLQRRPATPPSAPPPPPPDPMPDVSENAYAVLRGSEGELFELPGLENVIGRSTACDTCIPGSQAISNRHMCISFASDGTASIRDIGSRNGTFLNDHRVAGTALVMKSGDKVQLGVDGPSYVFTWGPAYYARWPRELQRASGARGRSSSRAGRQG